MPATSLKIVGTGACLPWCSISSSFQNSFKMSGHRGYEFLKFWCWNLVPFLPDIRFQLLKSLWSSLTFYFSFNDAPNVLYRWKIWMAGRPIQHSDSSTMKPCCCNSCSMHPRTIRDAVFWTECWWHTGRSPSSLAWRTRCPWFPTIMSKFDLSDQRTLFHFETVHFKWALAHRTRWYFWTMFTYGFLVAW